MKTFNKLESKLMQEKMSFSREILGPIFYEFCYLFHEQIANYYNNSDYAVLYMSRGGLRLRYLYQLYRKLNNLKCNLVERDFYISRLACAKSCLYTDFDYVFNYSLKMEANKFLNFFESMIKKQELNQDFEASYKQGDVYHEKLKKTYEENYCVRNYFWEQHQKLKKYLDNLLQEKEKIIVVDSGWTGNTQGILMRNFPQYEWIGLYFAKWARNKPKPAHFSRIQGISIDDSIHNKYPRSCIFSYPLLIEAILEFNFPSTEEYQDQEGIVTSNTGIASESTIGPNSNDPYFLGIVEYFKEQSRFNVNEIYEKANDAYKHLFRLIKFPKKSEVSMMDCTENASFLILQKTETINSLKAKRDRIRKAQWKSGQTALEFSPPIARSIQALKVFENF